MKVKHTKRWSLLMVTCMAMGVLPLTGFTQIDVDFQSDLIGDPPSDALFITASASVTVQDGEPIFGGSGTKSMLINTTTSGFAGNTWVVFKGDTAYESGSFATEVYGQNNLSHTYIRLGNHSTGTGIPNDATGVNLHIRWGNHFSSWDADNVVYSFDQILQINTVYIIAINFDSASETWSGTINGSAITAGSGTITTFDYASKNNYDVKNIDRVHFFASSANNGALTYVDNLTLIPEPSSVTIILGLSALLIGLFRIRGKGR